MPRKLLLKILTLFCFVTLAIQSCSAQNWQWGIEGTVSNPAGAEGWNMAEDSAHNAILTGAFSSPLRFGSTSLSAYNDDLFIVKYDPNGNLIWAKQATLPSEYSSELYNAIAIDSRSNSYLSGYFFDTLIFGAYKLFSPNSGSIFLVKYDVNGNVLWAKTPVKSISGANGDEAVAVAVDRNSNSYISGFFDGKLIFGASAISSTLSEMYLAKYNANGNAIWAKQPAYVSNADNSIGTSLTTDNMNNIYLAGYFSDTLKLGSSLLTTLYQDIFLAKYDTSGNVIWAKQSGSYGCTPNFITADKKNNIYMVGSFVDSITFSSKPLISGSGYTDLFIAKFDSSGNYIWGRAGVMLDSTNNWSAYTVAVDTIGHVYVSCGGTSGGGVAAAYTMKYASDTFSAYVSTYDGVSLVLELDSSGKFLCGNIVAGGGDDQNAITTDPAGKNVYFGGDLWATVKFGSSTLPYEAGETPFIARWTPCTDPEGIEETSRNKSAVKLFPNPNNGRFTLLFHSDMVNDSKPIVEIYNALGVKVFQESLQPAQINYSVDLNELVNGIYLYRITTLEGNLIGNGKFVIQK